MAKPLSTGSCSFLGHLLTIAKAIIMYYRKASLGHLGDFWLCKGYRTIAGFFPRREELRLRNMTTSEWFIKKHPPPKKDWKKEWKKANILHSFWWYWCPVKYLNNIIPNILVLTPKSPRLVCATGKPPTLYLQSYQWAAWYRAGAAEQIVIHFCGKRFSKTCI